jgi:hypothetical protein
MARSAVLDQRIPPWRGGSVSESVNWNCGNWWQWGTGMGGEGVGGTIYPSTRQEHGFTEAFLKATRQATRQEASGTRQENAE